MAFQLLTKYHTYSAPELLHAETQMLSGAEKSALDFARQWLGGEQEFTIHTSGSTGAPKAIQISRQRMQASAQLTLKALELTPANQALLCINPEYIGGKMMLVRAMEGGLPLMVLEPMASPLKELPSFFQPQFVALVPLQLQAILDDAASLVILNKMKAVIVGGAAVSAALEEEAQEAKVPIYSTYGMTETVSHVALRRINGRERQEYFTALPGIRLDVDSRACLLIDGPVAEGRIVTNDVVELLEPDKFRWLGRADNIINSGGVKVQAEQLEAVAGACLSGLGEERRLLAGGRPDEKLGQRVVLLIEGEPLTAEVKQQLFLCLQAKVPRYWVPKEILFLTEFVESNNGKIKREENWARL